MKLYKNYRKSQTASFGLTKILKPTIRLRFVNKGIIYNLLWKAYRRKLMNIENFQTVKNLFNATAYWYSKLRLIL